MMLRKIACRHQDLRIPQRLYFRNGPWHVTINACAAGSLLLLMCAASCGRFHVSPGWQELC